MAGAKKMILVIDHDKIQLSAAEAILKTDYEIITAESGEKALEYFNEGIIPDLVLADILAPKMAGWETYGKIQSIAISRKIPVAFLASAGELKDKNRTQKIGSADYIIKPYVKEDLLHRVKNLTTPPGKQ